MSLHLTVARPDIVCQVTDTRFTSSKGFEDYNNKALVVECANGIFTCCYAGIGRIGTGEMGRTDFWLAEVFLTLSRESLAKVIGGLTSAAQKAVTPEVKARYARYTHAWEFNLAGWGMHSERGWIPFSATISNMWDSNGDRLSSPLPTFTSQVRWPNNAASFGNSLLAVRGGAGDAVDENSWNKLTTAGKVAKPRDLIRLMVKTLRTASKHSQLGRYISQDYLSMKIFGDKRVEVLFHPEGSKSKTVIPVFVRQGIAAGGGTAELPKGWSMTFFPRPTNESDPQG